MSETSTPTVVSRRSEFKFQSPILGEKCAICCHLVEHIDLATGDHSQIVSVNEIIGLVTGQSYMPKTLTFDQFRELTAEVRMRHAILNP